LRFFLSKKAPGGKSFGRFSRFFAIGFRMGKINFLKSLDTAKIPVRKSTGYRPEAAPRQGFTRRSGPA
jgi:hypothetical protein